MKQPGRIAAGVVAAMAAWGIWGVRVAAAADQRVALIWNAPAGCPTTQAVQDELDRILAGSPKDVAPVAAAVNVLAPSRAAVTPSPSNDRWRASLMVHSHGKRAERQFDAESCEALAAAATLIIALAAEGVDESTPAQPAGAIPPPARPADNVIGAQPAKPEAGWNSVGQHLVLGSVLDTGTMPGHPALGFEAAAAQIWTAGIWRLQMMAGASFFVPQDLGNPMEYGKPSGRYWMVSFSGRACLTTVVSRFEIGPCLGAELPIMHGSKLFDLPSTDTTQYWLSALGSAMAALTVSSRVVLFARADIIAPSTQRAFVMTDPVSGGKSDAYKIPSYALRGAMGLELRF
jgi:hypothetical protein